MTPFLKVKNLTKTYLGNEQPAVSGLAFSIKKGEVVSFVGPSGSGKSTLLKMIGGLISADHGSIDFMGKPLDSPEDKLIAGEEGIKMLFQDLKLMPNHTVEENVKYPMLLMDAEYQERRTEELLELCQLQAYKSRLPRLLSGGQQQRLALAKTLAEEPNLLLVDEPFSNLDPIVKRELILALKEIVKSEKVSLIMVTHDTEDALIMSDKIGFLFSGRLMQFDNPTNVYHKPKSVEIASFFGQVNVFKASEFREIFEGASGLELTLNQSIGVRAEAFSSTQVIDGFSVCGVIEGCFFLGTTYLIYLKLQSRVLVLKANQNFIIGEKDVFYVARHSLILFS